MIKMMGGELLIFSVQPVIDYDHFFLANARHSYLSTDIAGGKLVQHVILLIGDRITGKSANRSLRKFHLSFQMQTTCGIGIFSHIKFSFHL